MRIMTGVGLLTGLAIVAGSADAATTTATFGVSLAITAQCVINSTTLMDFNSGTIGVININHDATSTLKLQCTNTTPFNIGLDAGTTSGGTVAQRLLVNSGNTINYNLYTAIDHATVWGNTVLTDTVASTGTGAEQTFTIYGRVPPQTTPAPATYTDLITVTITY
jgi:spore coat protein U-like protein